MGEDLQPGDRQTVDRAKHPTFGEGIAVYDNGPAWFRADTGEVETFKRISFGGCGVDGSRLHAVRQSGERIDLDTTKRQAGDRHARIMTNSRVRGWLVQIARLIDEPCTPFIRERFEPDGGTPVKMHVVVLQRGTPGALNRHERRKPKRFLPEEEHWITYTLSDKTDFVFCYEQDADKVCWPKPKGGDKEQRALPGVSQ
jgi:hypothetical protein